MIKFDILNRFSGAVQFTAEIDCAEDAPRSLKLGLAVKWAIKTKADLTGADLTGADLTRANLTRADLTGADLTRADLSEANLSEADLTGADLTRADLSEANLSEANLTRADLSEANLSEANLTEANLTGVDLSGANLTWANLTWADLIAGASRSDGYRFLLVRHKDGGVYLQAGCRRFPIADARAHWIATRAGTPLGEETFAILDHLERVAVIRGWLPKAEGK